MTRFNKIFVSLLAVSVFLLGVDSAYAQKAVKVGKKLPAWEEDEPVEETKPPVTPRRSLDSFVFV